MATAKKSTAASTPKKNDAKEDEEKKQKNPVVVATSSSYNSNTCLILKLKHTEFTDTYGQAQDIELAISSSHFNGCCAFSTLCGFTIQGLNQDNIKSFESLWNKASKYLLDDVIYKQIVSYCKSYVVNHISKSHTKTWVMTLSEATKGHCEYNKWLLKLYKDAWNIDWYPVIKGKSRSASYGITLYVHNNQPMDSDIVELPTLKAAA